MFPENTVLFFSLKSNIKLIKHYQCDIMKHTYDIMMFLTGIHMSHITEFNDVSDSNQYLIIQYTCILRESGTCEHEMVGYEEY
jgi:uncharacterized membrane protein SirB2